jgi:hypothetical protein
MASADEASSSSRVNRFSSPQTQHLKSTGNGGGGAGGFINGFSKITVLCLLCTRVRLGTTEQLVARGLELAQDVGATLRQRRTELCDGALDVVIVREHKSGRELAQEIGFVLIEDGHHTRPRLCAGTPAEMEGHTGHRRASADNNR